MIESPEQIAIENEIKVQKDKFLSYFNGSLPDTMELEFEGFYRRGFFVSKKRYAVIEDGKIDILMAILEEGNVKKAEKIISKVLKQIKSGNLDRKELVIHTQITKNLDDYKQVGPHVIAAREIESHGIKVGKGTIVQYIIAKGKGSISQRAVPYEYSEGIEYDKEYYIENQLIPAVSRMMEPLGYDKDRLRELQ